MDLFKNYSVVNNITQIGCKNNKYMFSYQVKLTYIVSQYHQLPKRVQQNSVQQPHLTRSSSIPCFQSVFNTIYAALQEINHFPFKNPFPTDATLPNQSIRSLPHTYRQYITSPSHSHRQSIISLSLVYHRHIVSLSQAYHQSIVSLSPI